jgi:hypothetical protein
MMTGEKFDTPPRSGYHTGLMSEQATKVAVKLDFEAMKFKLWNCANQAKLLPRRPTAACLRIATIKDSPAHRAQTVSAHCSRDETETLGSTVRAMGSLNKPPTIFATPWH